MSYWSKWKKNQIIVTEPQKQKIWWTITTGAAGHMQVSWAWVEVRAPKPRTRPLCGGWQFRKRASGRQNNAPPPKMPTWMAGTCEYGNTLTLQRDFADVIKSTVLRWGCYPGLSRIRSKVTTRVPEEEAEGLVSEKTIWWWKRRLEWWARSQGLGNLLEAGQLKEQNLP